MADTTDASELNGVTCVIPIHDDGMAIERVVQRWTDALKRLGRSYEILLVDDGSRDDTPATAAKLLERLPFLRLLSHDTRRGFGACLRTAVPEARYKFLFYTNADESYSPGDLRKLFERVDIRDEVTGQCPTLVNGCRTGQRRPRVWQALGWGWRVFCRVALGLPLEASPAWLGFREHAFSYFFWVVFGDPLVDPNSKFKLWRTEFLKRVPIQSDGEFVHVELVAKATFLTRILDEIPLTPAVSPSREMPSVWSDFRRVLRNPDFGRGTLPAK